MENTINMIEIAYIIGKSCNDNELKKFISESDFDGITLFAEFVSYIYNEIQKNDSWDLFETVVYNFEELEKSFIELKRKEIKGE